MINFLSSWAEQIVLAVIIATLFELILPKNKNKKYIQMVIGVYVLFNIISPILETEQVFSFDEYNIEKDNVVSGEVLDQKSMDERIEKIYLDELEDTVITKFEKQGFKVKKCTIDAELDSSRKNAGIHLITVKLETTENSEQIDEIKKDIATEFEIEEDKININIG